MGAALGPLIGTFRRNGWPAPRNLPLAAAMVLSALARAPFQPLERARFERLRRTAPPLEAPLFVIGHWRSGTTHLHNLLGCSPQFGYVTPLAAGLPNEILTLGTWLRPWLEKALPEDRHVDHVAVTPTSPQEDEIPLANLQGLSVFHAIYFARNFEREFARGVFFEGCTASELENWARLARLFLEKIALHQQKPRLLIKNPVYTARLRHILRIWPDASFIHIRRDPYQVFVSTKSYYRKMLQQLSLQDHAPIDLDRFVRDSFIELMNRYESEKSLVRNDRLVEVSYERLCASPLEVIADIHGRLSLADAGTTLQRVSAYLTSIEGYETNKDSVTAADRATVDSAWSPQIRTWQDLTNAA